jgi:transcriptional regulator with PAS, ATPase and Fis domain
MERFKRHTLLLLVFIHTALVLCTIGAWILFSEILRFDAVTTLIATAGSMIGIGLLAGAVLEHIITKPFQLLHDAVHFMHTDKQQNAPDMSSLMMGHSIVSETISKLYELASNINTITHDLRSENEYIQHLLNELPAAVLVLDTNQRVIYANEIGKQTLENPTPEDFADLSLQKLTNLRFEDQFTLSAWLADCRENNEDTPS